MLYSFYVGCYTSDPKDKGIHLLTFDSSSGKLHVEDPYYGGESPSFLVSAGNFLYAANETGGSGKVSALSIGTGNTLKFLNSREVSGAGTCHIAKMNSFLYAANYVSGSIFGVEILKDGSLGSIVTEIGHTGSGPNPMRQEAPHAHSVNPVPDTDLLIAADLGADRLFCYKQQANGSLTPDSASYSAASPSGGGPRHMAFHHKNKRVYVVMEMGVSVTCYKLTNTFLELEARYPLVEGSFTQDDTAADIHLTADGERLYATVRGKNLLSVFNILDYGKLQFIGSYPTYGDSPRNFCLTPGEEFAVIAHDTSGHVTICPIDPRTGAVGNTLGSVILPGASCVINA